MKCKHKTFEVEGFRQGGSPFSMQKTTLQVIVTNDEIGKTISVNDGSTGFTFPADVIAEYLK